MKWLIILWIVLPYLFVAKLYYNEKRKQQS